MPGEALAEALLTGGREERGAQEGMPGADSFGSMRPAEGEIGVTEDSGGLVQHVGGGVPAAYPGLVPDPPSTRQVLALPGDFEVLSSVVLMHGVGADEPQVRPSDGVAMGVAQYVLRLDLDAADLVQEPEQALPGGLRTVVCEGNGSPQRRSAAPSTSSCRVGLRDGACPTVQGGIDDDHHVVQGQVARTGQQYVDRWVDADPSMSTA